MEQFEFKGQWEFSHQFDAFKGLQSRGGSYTSKDSKEESIGQVQVIILDELNDDPNPNKEQLLAIDYLSNNPEKIKTALLKAVEANYAELKDTYGYNEEDEDDQLFFPSIESLEDYRNVFGIGNVFIHVSNKDGLAYIGFEGGCSWDEEHGLGIVLHQDRLVDFGQADTAFNPYSGYKDAGTDKAFLEKMKLRPNPKKYAPHPIYGTFKESQKRFNDRFDFMLIEQGYHQEFIDLVNKGEIKLSDNNVLNKYFESACKSNNLELVKYLLGKNVILGSGIEKYLSTFGNNKEVLSYLINVGCDIDHQDEKGNTVLLSYCRAMARTFGRRARVLERGDNWEGEHKKYFILQKKCIENLLLLGADPMIKNNLSEDVFNVIDKLASGGKEEMRVFIKTYYEAKE